MKQVLVVRKDLNMRKGKIAAQCAHASIKILLDYCLTTDDYDETGGLLLGRSIHVWVKSPLYSWLFDHMSKKICVYVNSDKELIEIHEKARSKNIMSSVVWDFGLTEFKGVLTNTVAAIGPDEDEKIDEITGNLPLL